MKHTKPTQTKQQALRKLIQIEWDILHDLQTNLTTATTNEKIKISNSIAYHINNLNKLLTQQDELQAIEDETTLAQLIQKLPKKHRQTLTRQIKKWTKQQNNSSKN